MFDASFSMACGWSPVGSNWLRSRKGFIRNPVCLLRAVRAVMYYLFIIIQPAGPEKAGQNRCGPDENRIMCAGVAGLWIKGGLFFVFLIIIPGINQRFQVLLLEFQALEARPVVYDLLISRRTSVCAMSSESRIRL